MMAQFLQLLVLGLLLGGIYVAVGVGFSLVWGVLNIVNLAHGAIIMLGSYLTWVLFARAHVDPFVSLPLVAAFSFGFGYLLQRLLINRVVRAQFLYTFLLTFGINLFLISLLLLLFKADFRSVSPAYGAAGLQLGGVVLPYVRLAALVIALLMAIGLAAILNRTRTGDGIQAVGADKDAAQLVGVDLRHTYAITFGLGAACAGVAGTLISTIQAISPYAGEPYTLQAFVVVILGGLGRVSAAVLGGMLFGLIEVFAQAAPGLGAGYANAIAFGVLVLVLAIRPQGLYGKKEVR